MFALALSACLAMPGAARAQAFSFSIGHGHHHHHRHHHHGWHLGYWHDPYWWGPHYDYVYVAPPPVVRREIRYVEPVVEQQVIETRVVPPRVTSPARTQASSQVASSTTRAAAQTPLQIWNSAGQKLPVAFVVDGQEVTLADGQSHTFYGGGAKLVEFDRGGDYGTARRSLTGSQYEFVITDTGWDLVRRGEAAASVTQAPRNALPR